MEPDMASTGLTNTIASTATLKLASLHSHHLFCTPLEERFERITRLARRALDVPVTAVTVVNGNQQWFKSVAGWQVTQLGLERSYCKLTLESGEVTVISDSSADQRTAGHPLASSATPLLFYAGYPLADEHGNLVGTFCVLDIKPRRLSADDRKTFEDLGALAQRELLADQLRDIHRALTSKLGVARREAMLDSLTKLWNRRGANVLLRAALEDVERRQTPLALAMLDLDNFKRINDNYGHQTGDEVLSRIARRLVRSVRAKDPVCRMGGDEFLVIMTHTDEKTAGSIAGRLRAAVADQPVTSRMGGMPMRVSAGYAVRQPGEQTSVDALIALADDALRQSKEGGRIPASA